MKNTLSKLIIFAAGAAVGSFITWKIVDEKYQQLTQEEIDSVKDMYAKKYKSEPTCEASEDSDDNAENTEVDEYADLVEGYTSNEEEKGGSVSMDELIKVISPDEVGDIPDYDVITLYYYADGVLVDENDEEVIDPHEIIGKNALTSFGEYEDDSVFVQNDDRKCYYEILQDVRSFSAGVSADLLNQANWYDEE